MRQGTHFPQESPFSKSRKDLATWTIQTWLVDGGKKTGLLFVIDVLPVGPFRIDGEIIEQNPPVNDRFIENIGNILGSHPQVEESLLGKPEERSRLTFPGTARFGVPHHEVKPQSGDALDQRLPDRPAIALATPPGLADGDAGLL